MHDDVRRHADDDDERGLSRVRARVYEPWTRSEPGEHAPAGFAAEHAEGVASAFTRMRPEAPPPPEPPSPAAGPFVPGVPAMP